MVASKDTVTAFETFDVTVTAFDAYDNIAVGYVGTVKFSSTDTSAEVPVDYTFSGGSSADNGVHTFMGLVLKTGGSQTVTATDAVTTTITGTSGAINVNKANATIAITPYGVTYDGNAHTATGTATGVKGEDLSGLLNLSGTTHTNAGDYPSDGWSFSGNASYNPASGTVHDSIGKAEATITSPVTRASMTATPMGRPVRRRV